LDGCEKMVDSLFCPFSGEGMKFFHESYDFMLLQLACGGVGLWWYFTYGPGALVANAANGTDKEPKREGDSNNN
jgi:hypothetical protein